MEYPKKAAMAAELPINAIKATEALRMISGIFSLERFRSRAASKTMKINPMVPSSSKTKLSKGMDVSPIAFKPCRMAMPIAINTKTLGILVRFASKLAK